MSKSYTNLGTNELHRRHSILIEGGQVPRSRVMDQTIIDRYLMDDLLNIGQHQAGEYLLQQAVWAGMWPAGMSWGGSGGSPPGCRVPYGVESFGNSLRSIRRELGDQSERITRKVVVDNSDVSGNMLYLTLLQKALDFIADTRCGRTVDPIRNLERALG